MDYKIILIDIMAFIVAYLLLVLFWIVRESRLQKKKILKKGRKKTKRANFFKKVFIQAPRQIAIDKLNKEPDDFGYTGIVIFEGKQGRGKSISLIEYATRIQQDYPKSKCLANLKYDKATQKLTHWKQLLSYKNGKHGVVVIIDELQNWFSCKDSKNFPQEMLSVVTQNRKNRRIILGTAQNFYMLSKDIRTQCTEVRSCFTLLGCITFVLRREPICNSAGDVEKWKYRGMYWYVHTPELRNSYDTYEVIERFQKSGFVERSKTVQA